MHKSKKPSLNSEENYTKLKKRKLFSEACLWPNTINQPMVQSSFYKVILFNLMNMQNYVGNCTLMKQTTKENKKKVNKSRAFEAWDQRAMREKLHASGKFITLFTGFQHAYSRTRHLIYTTPIPISWNEAKNVKSCGCASWSWLENSFSLVQPRYWVRRRIRKNSCCGSLIDGCFSGSEQANKDIKITTKNVKKIGGKHKNKLNIKRWRFEDGIVFACD